MEITAPQLPEDVVVNILSRLPVKYLLQFKCVCKSWLSLISDPHFAKLQLAQSNNNNNLNCHRFLFITNPLGSAKCEDYLDDHDLDHVNQVEYPAVMKNMPGFDKWVGDMELGGFCNGLICVAFSNGRIFLWNPTIREALELSNNGDFNRKDRLICGLGYDFLVDDYKVLKARYSHQAISSFSVNDFEILALKSNIWHKVEEKGHESDYLFEGLPQAGIFFHGALHWIAKRTLHWIAKRRIEIRVILVFSMVEEKFYELVELPDSIEQTKLYFPVLRKSGESLFLFCGDLNSNDLEAWQLKEYGVKSSWIKIYSEHGCTNPGFRYWGSVLHYTKTGKFLMFDYGNRGLVWYDPKENTWKTVAPIGLRCPRHAIYVESLVLPDWYRPTNA